MNLENLYILPQKIEAKTAELKRLNEMKYAISVADPSREVVSGGLAKCKFEEIIIKIEDLETEIAKDTAEYLKYLSELNEVIDTLEEKERLYIKYRYIERLTYEEIAKKMNYSIRQIFNIRKKVCIKFH